MYEIKKQAEDFIVNEITEDGAVLDKEKYGFDEKSSGEHLICVLRKRDWDTLLAVKKIAKTLRVSPKRIGFAGTKDKKAVTTQLISIYGLKKEDIEKISIKDMEIFPLKYSDERIMLGNLTGNRFTIKIYSGKKPKKINKVPNYFGEQRFGTKRPITHLVGREIIRKNPKNAVMMYLSKSFRSEDEETRKIRDKLANNGSDFKKALEEFPTQLKFERIMLNYLVQNKDDYVGALRSLPKSLNKMFIHAYQSHLFNDYLNTVIRGNKDFETGPLYGYELELENESEQEFLEKNGVTLNDFRISYLKELSSKGTRRKLFVDLNDFEVIEKKKDYSIVRFSLPKGSYATVAVDFLFS